jgi:bacteriocin biosynthesis cyclodehydratase domain-containing protein
MNTELPATAHDAMPAGDSRLSAHGLQIVRLGPDEAIVKKGLSEVRCRLPGVADVLERVAELADSGISEDILVESFPPRIKSEIELLVRGLRARGLFEKAEDHTDSFWLSVGALAPNASVRLSEASALVVGNGPLADSMASALVACGVGHVDTGSDMPKTEDCDLWCAAVEEPADPSLLVVAARALAAGVVFLPTWIDDLCIRVGPMTHPFDTACLRCYLLRADSNDPEREVHRLLRQQGNSDSCGAGFLPPMASVAGQIAGMEAVKYLSGLPVTTTGHVIEMSLVPFRCDVRRVLRVPRCPMCSGVTRQGAPIVAVDPQLVE